MEVTFLGFLMCYPFRCLEKSFHGFCRRVYLLFLVVTVLVFGEGVCFSLIVPNYCPKNDCARSCDD